MSIPRSEMELAGHEGHLTASQMTAFEEFKQQVDVALDSSTTPQWYSDTTLLRFLRARSFNVSNALKQFVETDQWRKEADVDHVYQTFPIEEMIASSAYYTRWTGRRDRLGRPLYVYRLSSLTKEHIRKIYSQSEEERYHAIMILTEILQRFVFEVCSSVPSASSPTPISGLTTILDLSGLSLGTLWSLRSHLQQSMTLSSAHYPETLGTIAVVNAPYFFPTAWTTISKFFDEGTRRKVFILGSQPGPTLLKMVSPEDLPKVYGGELEWTFEDEPILDEVLQDAIGVKTLPHGPLAWEYGKLKVMGTVPV